MSEHLLSMCHRTPYDATLNIGKYCGPSGRQMMQLDIQGGDTVGLDVGDIGALWALFGEWLCKQLGTEWVIETAKSLEPQ